MAEATVALRFSVECAQTKTGDAVFICGSAPELGSWKPENAVPCSTTPTVFPKWASETVVLPLSSDKVEFKVIIMPADGSAPGRATWEGGVNRALHMPKADGKQVQMTASCAWGAPEVTYRTKVAGAAASQAAAAAEDVEERRDNIGELRSISHMGRMSSRNNAFGGALFGKRASAGHLNAASSLARLSSRHLCIGTDGILNTEMSRTPSLMLVEVDELEQECQEHAQEIEELERERLNKMQRRMPSGSLLESMKGLIDEADKSKLVLLQGFNWESWRAGGGDWYSVVGKKIDTMKDLGVTDIWLPPCSQSVAPQGYLPSQLFNLNDSKYGSQDSLQSLIKSLHENDIRAVADIVVNHRCGDKQDGQGRWNQFTSGSGIEHRPSFAGVMDWGGWAITLGDRFSDGTGENHPGHFDGKFDAAPDIDHKNKRVQDSISIWLRWLQLQVGFDAWRFDFVKGYGAEFVGLYCKKSAPSWSVGELWGDMRYDDNGLSHNQDGHRQDLVNWINATDKQSTAFDFTTKGVLQEAVGNCQYWRLRDCNGKPPGLIGWMPKYAVTFIDNHDTGSTQRHWPFPDDKVLVGYAYILTHPGIPSLFWDHVFDWGEHHRNQICQLLKARRESGIPVDAPVNILCADHDLYMAEIGSPPALRVALGPRHAGEADGNYWQSGPAGNQYRVWVHRTVVEPPKIVVKEEPKQEPKVEETKKQGSPKAEKKEKKKGSPKADSKKQEGTTAKAPAVCFPPLEVDGEKLTPEGLEAMSKEQLKKVSDKLEPVVQAAKDLQAAM